MRRGRKKERKQERAFFTLPVPLFLCSLSLYFSPIGLPLLTSSPTSITIITIIIIITSSSPRCHTPRFISQLPPSHIEDLLISSPPTLVFSFLLFCPAVPPQIPTRSHAQNQTAQPTPLAIHFAECLLRPVSPRIPAAAFPTSLPSCTSPSRKSYHTYNASFSLFTPSGSLLATGTSPTAPDAKKSRTYSALAANIWSAYERVAVQGVIEQSLPTSTTQDLSDAAAVSSTAEQPSPSSGLKSLTLELSDYNLHIQLVAPRVLLCLIGPKTPTRHTSSSSSLHSQEGGDKGTPPGSVPKSGGSGGGSGGTPVQGSVGSGLRAGGMGSLGILKTQAQALVDYLEKELKGFELPEGI